MDRETALLCVAAAEVIIGKRLRHWEIQVKREKSNIAEVKKSVDFWLQQVGRAPGGKGSMVERSLKEASKLLGKSSSLLDPMSQIDQLGEGIPGPSRRRAA